MPVHMGAANVLYNLVYEIILSGAVGLEFSQ